MSDALFDALGLCDGCSCCRGVGLGEDFRENAFGKADLIIINVIAHREAGIGVGQFVLAQRERQRLACWEGPDSPQHSFVSAM